MASLNRIGHIVVLMLENRSFDHVLGYLKKTSPDVAGMADSDFNYEDPVKQVRKVQVSRATRSALLFDPSHEYPEVQVQLYGPGAKGGSRRPKKKAAMSGFICSSAAPGGKRAKDVMECFQPNQLPILTTLAAQYGIINYWYSSIPGPTWPNRFFVHAGTSGGLTESPGTAASILGFEFKSGTIYDRLTAARKDWRVYHTDVPQVIGIRKLRKHYISGSHFRQFGQFRKDVAKNDLPEYSFIEPDYDVFNDFVDGNSMHPRNDVANGERLVKEVYEAIRGSDLWGKTMLIITFDEHGGFYDHISPPPAVATGDDTRYATKGRKFKFDRYGVRVPTIVVSPYTAAGTVVGRKPDDGKDVFDHCSILSTVEKRFGLAPLTRRDATANTLETLLNLDVARDEDAPKKLPSVKALSRRPSAIRRRVGLGIRAAAEKPLTKQQEAFLGLAIACDMEMRAASGQRGIAVTPVAPRTKAAAASYAKTVQARVLAHRSRRR